MRTPALVAVAAALVLSVAHPSGAATSKLHISDPAGDANGVNGQGIGLPAPGRSTAPAQVAGADILGIDLVNRFKTVGKVRKPNGFTVTLKLAAPLQSGTVLTVTMVGSALCGESKTIQLGAGTSALAICQSANPAKGSSTTIGTTELSRDRKTVTWQIDNIYKAGVRVSDINASSSVFVLGVFDEVASGAVFTYGK
jgi:hypothetical protein